MKNLAREEKWQPGWAYDGWALLPCPTHRWCCVCSIVGQHDAWQLLPAESVCAVMLPCRRKSMHSPKDFLPPGETTYNVSSLHSAVQTHSSDVCCWGLFVTAGARAMAHPHT